MITIDLANGQVTIEDAGRTRTHALGSPEGFKILSAAWLRAGWDAKYVYSFTWMGRPVIQLPEDLIRVQEAIYRLRPTVIIETGVAHGGSLVFYASLLKAMGLGPHPVPPPQAVEGIRTGRVIGIDIEIRPHNRQAIEEHELADLITLVEGSSTAAAVVQQVRGLLRPSDRVFVMLDSNHSKAHVLAELEAYADLVTPGSYIVAADGIMADLGSAPRTNPDWSWNNPRAAVEAFLRSRPDFSLTPPPFAFNEGVVDEAVTYWPGGWLRKRETGTAADRAAA
jgi:cephalosporin hydroxylase